MKKVFSLMLALAMLLILCSSAFAAPMDTSFVSNEAFTIKINTNQKSDQEMAQIQKALDLFHVMYPNGVVDINYGVDTSDWGDYATRLLAQFASGEQVDVIWIALEGIAFLASNDVIVPLDDYVVTDAYLSDRLTKDVGEEVLRCMKYQDKLYGIPLGWNNTVLIYNTRMFKEAGIEHNDNWTWDEFLEDCQKLTTTDANGEKVWALALTDDLTQYQAFLAGNGTYDMNPEWTESWWTKPETIETFQYVNDLVNKYGVCAYPEDTWYTSYFTAERVAMFMAGPWEIKGLESAGFTDWDFITPPSKNGVKGASYGVDGYCMTNICKHTQEALDFMKLLTSDDIQIMIAELGTSTPSTISAAYSDAYLGHSDHVNICYDTILDPDANVRIISAPTFLPDISVAFNNYWMQALAGQITIEQMCETMDSEVTNLLQQQ